MAKRDRLLIEVVGLKQKRRSSARRVRKKIADALNMDDVPTTRELCTKVSDLYNREFDLRGAKSNNDGMMAEIGALFGCRYTAKDIDYLGKLVVVDAVKTVVWAIGLPSGSSANDMARYVRSLRAAAEPTAAHEVVTLQGVAFSSAAEASDALRAMMAARQADSARVAKESSDEP